MTLERFLEAQQDTYETALAEIKAGHKATHWMWWIFPQYKGLGYSNISQFYAIQSKEEAMAYWVHPILGERLRECIKALLDLETNDAVEVFGEVDEMKLQSCLSLFYYISGDKLCGEALDKFFLGEYCWKTSGILLRE